MRKELFFAIAAGGILGLIIAFGIWRVNSSFSAKKNNTEEAKETEKPNNNSVLGITVAKFENNDIATLNPILVTGIAKANSLLAISMANKDYLTQTDPTGSFEQEIDLVGGINEIVFTVFDQAGNKAEQKLNLVYSSEFAKLIKDEPKASPTPQEKTASAEANSIREKVQKKVEEALKQPKAYLGTVTDIAESTLQIKSLSGEIQQVSTGSETSFVKVDKTNKDIKYADVAIGDFIIALGFKNGNSVLEAKRVLVSIPPSPTEKRILFGSISKISKKEIVLSVPKQNSEEKILTTNTTLFYIRKDGKLSKIKLTDLHQNDKVVCFLLNVSGVRTIVLVEPSESTPSPSAKPTPTASPKN